MPKLGILYGSLINVGVVRAITTVIIVSKVETFRKKKKLQIGRTILLVN